MTQTLANFDAMLKEQYPSKKRKKRKSKKDKVLQEAARKKLAQDARKRTRK